MRNNKKMIFITIIVMALGFGIGAYLYKSVQSENLKFMATKNAETFVREHSPKLGPKDAPVYLVEFLDPECESCRRFYPAVKKLIADNPGKIRLVVRYTPFHGNSKFVIGILEAARMQGKFWETLELVFRYQPTWGSHHNPQPELLWHLLPEIAGLDIERIKTDMKDPKIADIIAQDVADGKALGVRATPTFFVNGKLLERFGYEFLKQMIEKELQ